MGLEQANNVLVKMLDSEKGKGFAPQERHLGLIEETVKNELYNNPVISEELMRNPVVTRELTNALAKALPDLAKKD